MLENGSNRRNVRELGALQLLTLGTFGKCSQRWAILSSNLSCLDIKCIDGQTAFQGIKLILTNCITSKANSKSPEQLTAALLSALALISSWVLQKEAKVLNVREAIIQRTITTNKKDSLIPKTLSYAVHWRFWKVQVTNRCVCKTRPSRSFTKFGFKSKGKGSQSWSADQR